MSEFHKPFAGAAAAALSAGFTQALAERLRGELPQLCHAGQAPALTGPAEAYYRHYQLGSQAARRLIGALSLPAGSTAPYLSVQVFLPTRRARLPCPTVLFLHGYLDHVGLNAPLIDALLSAGCAVCAVDLPGHGLSGGGRGTVSSFSEYGVMLHVLLSEIRAGRVPGIATATHLAVVAHSTGAAAVVEYLESGGTELGPLVFLAPLVRLYAFPLARIGVRLASGVVDSLPRRISGSSSNEEYLQFARELDPLGIYEASIEWAEAYLHWEEQRRELSLYNNPLLLVQAGRDTVVDVEYNTEFMLRCFPQLEYLHFPAARHSIFTEPEEKRPGLYRTMIRFLLDVDLYIPKQPG